jgi:hypothetical protein
MMWLTNFLDLAIALSYLIHVNPVNSLKQESRVESKIDSDTTHVLPIHALIRKW